MTFKISTQLFERCTKDYGHISCPNCNEDIYLNIPTNGDNDKCIHCGAEIIFIDE